MDAAKQELYWKKVIGFTMQVMALWAFFGYVPPIILADSLNSIKIGGAPLGFWFAHNGSIYAFWGMTLWYAKKMESIDREFDVNE